MSGFLTIDPAHPATGVRALLAVHDWRDCPPGHPGTWPPELSTAVGMALNSAFPMFVAWGPPLCFLYNDAYAIILGAKHPRTGAAFQAGLGRDLGRPGADHRPRAVE